MKARVVTLKVTLEKPAGVSMGNLMYAVDEAIRSMTGHLDPMNPLFEFDRDTVRVVRLLRRRITHRIT